VVRRVFDRTEVRGNVQFRSERIACDAVVIGYAGMAMSRYVLDHHLEGEKKRLALMSQLLDPIHRRQIESLGISLNAQVLEVGCGNGSISTWMPSMLFPMDMSLPWISIFRSSMLSMLRALSFARATSSRRQSIRAVSI
jgi:hypothetical protein